MHGPVNARPAPANLAASVQHWLAEEQVDTSYAAFVLQHLDAADATWRWCCGSNCDPCVQRLGRVVDRARAARAGDGPR